MTKGVSNSDIWILLYQENEWGTARADGLIAYIFLLSLKVAISAPSFLIFFDKLHF